MFQIKIFTPWINLKKSHPLNLNVNISPFSKHPMIDVPKTSTHCIRLRRQIQQKTSDTNLISTFNLPTISTISTSEYTPKLTPELPPKHVSKNHPRIYSDPDQDLPNLLYISYRLLIRPWPVTVPELIKTPDLVYVMKYAQIWHFLHHPQSSRKQVFKNTRFDQNWYHHSKNTPKNTRIWNTSRPPKNTFLIVFWTFCTQKWHFSKNAFFSHSSN